MKKVYLDHAATTPVDLKVFEAMKPYLTEHFGNPSALYSYGREAKQAIEEAREIVAGALGARNDEIVFTSGGTEADNFALEGVVYADKRRKHIITTAIEHHAVIETCKFLEKQGYDVTYLPVDGDGLVDPEEVQNAITEKTVLISVMYANNEVGVIQPVQEIGKIAKEAGVKFHTDAVQAFGAIETNVDDLGVDLLSISAHKLYGPKGTGVLYIRRGTKMVSFLHGGGQERNRRASTENVAGIVGLGKAVELAQKSMAGEEKRITGLRDKLIKGIMDRIPDVKLNGHPNQRLPNNVNVCISMIEGESILLNLDAKGICASTGSACSSKTLEPSHVLLAMGIPAEVAHGSLRMTLGRKTSDDDIEYVLETLPEIVQRLREMSPLYNQKGEEKGVSTPPV